jgi:Mrp family chromosome partitioning ATPase
VIPERHMTLADYLAVVRRRKWLVVFGVVVVTASALFFASRQHKLFEASTQVLVNPDASLISGAGKSASDAQARFDTTEAQLAHTPDVAGIAVKNAGVPGVSANGLVAHSSVAADNSSNILSFAVTNPSRVDAVKLANAYANAFQAFGTQTNTQSVHQAIADATTQINKLNGQIDAAKRAGNVPAGLRQELSGLIKERGRYQQQLVAATGGARVARYAEGAHQTQPNPTKDGVLGFLLGLVLGLVIAFTREALDTRVRSSEEIAERTGLKLLARIPTPTRALRSKNKLAMFSDRSDTEPYRKLRVAVDFANLGTGARTVMVTSAIEREGKSTTVANLAVALARTGRRVILVDLDLRRPTIATFFDLKGRAGITDVVLNHARLEDALAPIVVAGDHGLPPNGNGNGGAPVEGTLRVLPAGTLPPDPAEFLETTALANVLIELGRRADVVLIDSPPLVPVADGVTLAGHVDAMVVVAQAELLRRPLLVELRRLLETCRAAKLGFVLTGAEAEEAYGAGYGYGYGYGETVRAPSRPPAGVSDPVDPTSASREP